MKKHQRSSSYASNHGLLNVASASKNPFDEPSSSNPPSPRAAHGLNPFGSSSSSSSHNPFPSSDSNSNNPVTLSDSSSNNPFPSSNSNSVKLSCSPPNPFQYSSGSLECLNNKTFTEDIDRARSLENVKCLQPMPVTLKAYSPKTNFSVESDSPESSRVSSTCLRRNPRLSSSSYDSTFTDTTTDVPTSPEPKPMVHSHKANMTSILNDPYRRSRNYDSDLFTRTWGSYFVPTTVPLARYLPSDVPQEKFISYLKYLKDPWKQNRAKEKEAAALTRSRHTSFEDIDIDGKFLDPNFSLEDKETFEYVLPNSQFEVHQNHASSKLGCHIGKHQRSSKLLQERLSYNLDKVEILLAQQVSAKHNKFFETISSQERLHDDSNLIRNDIRELRNSLQLVDNEVNKKSLKILQLGRLRENYKKCHELLVQMSTVRQAQPTIQLLLSQSDFVGALDLISATQEVLQNDLMGIQSFRYLNVQLCEMERMIYNMIQSDFVKFTLSTLTLDEKTVSEVENDTDKIICVLFGLLRGRNTNFIQNYKTEANTMMKAKIKQILAEILSNVSFETDMKLDDQIRSLSSSMIVELLESVFNAIIKLLTKMKSTDKMIKAVITVAANREVRGGDYKLLSDHSQRTLQSQKEAEGTWMLSDNEYNRLINDINDVLLTSCDIAQTQCIKILTLQQQKITGSERLNQNSLFKLSRLVESFAIQCEDLTKKPSNIRVSLLAQSREVVRQFHEERVTNIRLLLETERWTIADVPADFQRMANNIVRGCTPTEVLVRRPQNGTTDPPSNYLVLNGNKYVVTSTLLLVIKMIVEYCQCVVDIPVMSKDILTKTVENLKHFNETTCQLVLRAGAMKNIGLKSITAKHLGVASQTLNVILEIVPWIRDIFKKNIHQHRLLDQLENLETDIQDHINQIFSKLINIMGDVYRTSFSSWQPKPPTPSPCITTVTRQTIKLHEALKSVLQPSEIYTVFKGVFCLFRKYFEEQLGKHGLMNNRTKKHGIVVAELSFYTDSVSILDFVGDTDDIFHDIGTR